MYKLFIESQEVDGFISNNMVLNAMLFNYEDFSSRGNGYSNAISIKKTGRNLNIFKLYDRTSHNVSRSAKIYLDRVLVLEGYARIIEDNRDSFKIQVIGKKYQLLSNLDNKSLMELDFRDEDFQYNDTSYFNLNNSSSGLWDWNLIDCTTEDDGVYIYEDIVYSINYILAYTRPSMRVKTILDKILSESGYTGDYSEISLPYSRLRLGAFANKFYFSDLHYNGTSISLNEGDYLEVKDLTMVQTPSTFFNIVTGSNNWTDYDIVAERIPSRIGVKISTSQTTGKLYISSRKGFKNEDSTEDFSITNEYDIIDGKATILTDVIDFENELDELRYGYSATRISFDRDITITEIDIYGIVDEKDYFESEFFSSNADWFKDFNGAQLPLLYFFYVRSSFNLPDWTQKEFIFLFMNLYNLDIEVTGNKVKFIDRNTSNKNNALEITKGDESSSNSPIGFLGKNNFFSYENDDSIQLNKFRYNHSIENENYLDNKSLLELPVSGTDDIIRYNVIQPYLIANVPILSKTERKSLAERIYYYYEDSTNLGSNVERVAYFNQRSVNTDTFSARLSMDYIYENYYNNVLSIYDDYQIKIFNLILSFIDYIKIKLYGIIYDPISGKYLRVLEMNKFNPSSKTELKTIGIK